MLVDINIYLITTSSPVFREISGLLGNLVRHFFIKISFLLVEYALYMRFIFEKLLNFIEL